MDMRQLAGNVLDHFREGSREAEHHGGKVTILDDAAPEWLREIVYDKSGGPVSDFRVEAAQAALMAIYDGDETFEPEFTEAHSRASYRALAHDSDLRAGVDRILAGGEVPGRLSDMISDAANDMMIGMFENIRDAMGNEIEMSDDPEI